MDQRKKEEKLMRDLKNPEKEHSSQISKLINDTIRSGHKVYLGGDWHLWLREEKDKPECHKRSDFNQILSNVRTKVGQDDLLIYMGDLVDGEFQDKEALKTALLSLGKNMILVKGNNDLFTDEFYKSCGFKYVVESFTWSNVLFTHVPVKNNKYEINVHAHLHSYHRYRIPYTNQIDVAWLGGRKEPVELFKVIKAQPKYSKIIIEEPEHFNESFMDDMDLFHQQFTSKRLYDPYRDEE